METVVGRDLERLRVKLIGSSSQAFALTWLDGSTPADISAYEFAIVFGTARWVAEVTGSTTTWYLTPEQTNLKKGLYSARLLYGTTVAYSVILEVQ